MQFNTMVCKGCMNFHVGAKKGGKPLARFPPLMPGPFLGEGSGQNRDYSITTPGKLRKSALKISFFRTFDAILRAQPRLFSGNRADREGVSVQRASDRGLFAGLLVECG